MAAENPRLPRIWLWAFWIGVFASILLSFLPTDFDYSVLGMAAVTACLMGFGPTRGSDFNNAVALAVLGAAMISLVVVFHGLAAGFEVANVERLLRLSKSARDPRANVADAAGLALAYGCFLGAAIRFVRALLKR